MKNIDKDDIVSIEIDGFRAGIAQLVEYKLPKLGVASSNLVARSTDSPFSYKGYFRPGILSMFVWFGFFSLKVIFMIR